MLLVMPVKYLGAYVASHHNTIVFDFYPLSELNTCKVQALILFLLMISEDNC